MVTTWGYNLKKGVNTSVSYSDSTPGIQYAYNCLNQLTQVTDASGSRTITYTPYNEPDTDSITIGGASCQLQEHYDTYGRSSGYTLKQGTDVLQGASQGYEANGRLAGAGIVHGGEEQTFAYGYLPGSSLPSSLAMPNGIVRELAYEEHRDLAVAISCRLGETALVSRSQSYDALGRPVTRTQQRGTEATRTDSFSYNGRNELTGATLGTAPYGYSYDNIGNRKTAQEPAQELAYAANELNQYTRIEENAEAPFAPQYDASGNQTLIRTSTGIWTVAYNAANRAVSFTSRDGATVVECGYDYQGRRYMKKVTQNGTVTSHERCLYRGYLQLAALDMLDNRNVLRTLLWDPLEPVATRPLALVQAASLYCYGWDFNKNVTEVFDARGTIAATYDYSPYGTVGSTGNLVQPVQWSSEMNDEELALVYYNYRYYNPADGRWINRDPIAEEGGWNLYAFLGNSTQDKVDALGLVFVMPIHTATGVPGYDRPSNIPGWGTALVNFLRWLIGTVPPYSIYPEGSEESEAIKNSPIGRDIMIFFKRKNKGARFCDEWENATNISISYPGFKSVMSFTKFKRDFERFFSSLPNGIPTFVGSCRGDVSIEIINNRNEFYINTIYKVTNTTSATSFFYHLMPSWSSGYPMGNWTQVYIWKEKIKCCKK